ncbi:MAG: site-specific integrase [Planctomycetota bacterium]
MLSFTDPTSGKRRRISTGKRDKGEAQLAAQEILAGRGSTSLGYTLAEALDDTWRARWDRQKGAKQLSYVVGVIREQFGSLQCTAIDYIWLEEWVNQLRGQGLAAATIRTRLGVVSVALDHAVKRRKLASKPPFPTISVNNTKVRYLDADEEQIILAKAMEISPTIYHLVCVLLDTGARLSEITKSRPSDVVGGDLRLEDTKNGKSRNVPLTSRAAASLRCLHVTPEWLEITRGVRTSVTRRDSAKSWCVKRFTKVRNAAGLPDVSLHTLRHTTASRLVQAGHDLYLVKEWLGHSTINVTERYAHLAPSSLKGMAASLEKPTGEVVQLEDRRR